MGVDRLSAIALLAGGIGDAKQVGMIESWRDPRSAPLRPSDKYPFAVWLYPDTFLNRGWFDLWILWAAGSCHGHHLHGVWVISPVNHLVLTGDYRMGC